MNRITFTSVVDTCIAAVQNSYGQREVPAWGSNETSAAARELEFILAFNLNFSLGAIAPPVSLGLLLIHEDFCCFEITHNDTSQSVVLLWTSDQLVAETSTWQHTTFTTYRQTCPGGIRNHDLSRRAAIDLRLRPRGHWDRHLHLIAIYY